MTNGEFVDDKKIKDILTYIRSMKHSEQIRMMFLFSLNGLRAINFTFLQVKDCYTDQLKPNDVINLGSDKNKGKHKCSYFEIPALAKPNSIIAYGNFERQIEYDYLEGTTFTIYELEDGKSAVCPIYDTEANKVFELTATRHGNKIECEYTDTKASFKIAVANTDKTVEIAPNFSGKVIIEL